MDIKTAFEVYESEGPMNPSKKTPRGVASRVVQSYCTPTELHLLAKAWRDTNSKALFRQRLYELKLRLIEEGKYEDLSEV